jgi:hypothetical protein
MPRYRVYRLENGHFVPEAPTPIDAGDDAKAIERAEQLVDGHDLELWDGARFILTLKSKDKK